ncbi:MAG: hypothetical protein U1E83_09585 [Methylotetracoccus sp.]
MSTRMSGVAGNARHASNVPDLPPTWRLIECDTVPDGEQVLGAVCFAGFAPERPERPDGAPFCIVPLTALDTRLPAIVWYGRGPTAGETHDALAYRTDGETLFGVLRDDRCEPGQVQMATFEAYETLLRAARELGYPEVYRLWNYLPRINDETEGLEVYKAFSIGRRRAFDRHAPIAGGGVMPAACAIGTDAPRGLAVCFLARRDVVSAVSNPRQIEAFDYPPIYGPTSPAFSRGVVVRRHRSAVMHLSGTASIVGHATRHLGDIDRQIDETIANLDALLQTVGSRLANIADGALLTVYLRHATDYPAARRRLSEVLKPNVKTLYLRGDICRRSLLVEIEGIIELPDSPRALLMDRGGRK